MTIRGRLQRLSAPLLACCAMAVLLALPADAETTVTKTLVFKELEKNSSFAFVDNAPKTKLVHGNPRQISAGDELVFQNPLVEGSKPIGHLEAVCTATKSTRRFDKADFMCQGTFVFAKGTLVASALVGKNVEGAITGGTGIYANARGTFKSVEKKNASTVTVTLVE